MKKKSLLQYILILLICSATIGKTNAQDNTLANCENLLGEYISDGQEYIAHLDENNRARFYSTFFGGSHYRIVACSDIKNIPLKMTIYDTEKNLLFNNSDYNYSPFWNFTFISTIDCIIEIEYKTDKTLPNEVMLLIGFKEK
ncbi:MAG TPA: hypothetical protein P5132_05590 [Bacteroidales bacterium]|nr:hypothetical protein [Bacteroidales bacterium]